MRKFVFVGAAAVAVAIAAIATTLASGGSDPVDWTLGPPAAFQYDADQMVGEATIHGLSGAAPRAQTDVYAYNWSENVPIALSGGGGAGAGKAQFSDFTIVKLVDELSPLLAVACATGSHLPEVEVAVKTKDGTMTYDLHQAQCSLDKHGATGEKEQLPLEEISFAYRSIKWTHESSKKGGTVSRCWDLAENSGGC